MMPRFRLLGLLSLLGAATSCAPTYYLGVKPAQPTGLFIEGREQAQALADSMEVRLSFVRYEPTRLVFEAEYRNPTKRPIAVAPSDFRVLPGRQPLPAQPEKARRPRPAHGTEVTAATAALSTGTYAYLPPLPLSAGAYDPEQEINAMQALAEKEAERATRFDWLGLALTATSIVADVSSIGKHESFAQYQSRAFLQEAAMTYNIMSGANKVRHALNADELRYQTDGLKQFALRKVTLEPGQQVYGLVYFPRLDTADELNVQAPGPNGPVPLTFRQTHTRH